MLIYLRNEKITEKDVLEIISTGVASVCKMKNVLELQPVECLLAENMIGPKVKFRHTNLHTKCRSTTMLYSYTENILIYRYDIVCGL